MLKSIETLMSKREKDESSSAALATRILGHSIRLQGAFLSSGTKHFQHSDSSTTVRLSGFAAATQ
jgi:hypothetical protein